MWNTGAGKGHHDPNVEMDYFGLSSQGWPHGGGDLDRKEEATGRAGDKYSPARGNRGWLQGSERGAPGDELLRAGHDGHTGPW